LLEDASGARGTASVDGVTDDDDPSELANTGRSPRRWSSRLGLLVPSDPAVAAVLRITAAAMVATILFWVFQ
jgi:hypothetical protein